MQLESLVLVPDSLESTENFHDLGKMYNLFTSGPLVHQNSETFGINDVAKAITESSFSFAFI